MKKIWIAFYVLAIVILLNSCAPRTFKLLPESSFKEFKYLQYPANTIGNYSLSTKKDSNTMIFVNIYPGNLFAKKTYDIRECNISTGDFEKKLEIFKSDEYPWLIIYKDSKLHIFSQISNYNPVKNIDATPTINNRLTIYERIIDTKTYKILKSRVVFSAATPDMIRNETGWIDEYNVEMPDTTIFLSHCIKYSKCILVPMINISKDSSYISFLNYINYHPSLFKKDSIYLYSTTIDLNSDRIIKYEKPYNNTRLANKSNFLIKFDLKNIFHNNESYHLSKGLLNNDGSFIFSNCLFDGSKMKAFNFIEMNKGNYNEIQLDLWDKLKDVLDDDEDYFVKDYAFIPLSDRKYEFIGYIFKETRTFSSTPTKYIVKIEIDFSNNQIISKNYLEINDEFNEKYHNKKSFDFTLLNSAYHSSNGDLILGFENIFSLEFQVMKRGGSVGEFESGGMKQHMKNLYVFNFGKNLNFKWLFEDETRDDWWPNNRNLDLLKAVFSKDTKNINFKYMCYDPLRELRRIEIEPETGKVVTDKSEINSQGIFRLPNFIRMDNKTQLYMERDCYIIFYEK